MTIAPLSTIALRQHGRITIDQALAVGLSRWLWYRLICDGVLDDAEFGVARLVGSPVTDEQRMLRVILGISSVAAASHASATYLWGGLDRLPEGKVDVIVLRSRCSSRPRDGVRVHRPVDWKDVGSASQRGIRVVQPVRALIDLGATHRHLVEPAVERLVIKGVVTRVGLERALRRHGRKGRAGVGPLRSVLAEWSFGDVPPASVLEVRMSELLVRHGLAPAVFHHIVNGFEIDAAWPPRRVGVEVDGWDKYTAQRQFQKQVERDAILRALGWTIVHFTWNDVVRRPSYVASIVRSLLHPSFSVDAV